MLVGLRELGILGATGAIESLRDFALLAVLPFEGCGRVQEPASLPKMLSEIVADRVPQRDLDHGDDVHEISAKAKRLLMKLDRRSGVASELVQLAQSLWG